MRNKFDEQLETLNREMINMGELCEHAIETAIKMAMDGASIEMKQDVLDTDSEIDRKEREIENICMKLLLRQQPVARDLRVISSALKMISDMERIGDQASDIVELADYIKNSKAKHKIHLSEMAKEVIKMDTPVPKVSYNIKVPQKDIEMSRRKYNLYLFVIFSIMFDDSSLFDEEAKNEKLMTNSLYVNILNCDTHTLISLINETSSYDRLLEKIVKCLGNISISKEDLERKKRVLISNEIFSFENLEIINEMIIDNIIFDGHIENDMIGLLKSLNYDELNRVISSLDLSNNCTVIMQGND